MAHFYADSSVLVKRHIRETGADWVRTLCDPSSRNMLITAQISIVEVYSALNRRVRDSTLGRADYTRVVNDFNTLYRTEYRVIDLSEPIVGRAQEVLERHPLRAYDAVQLASALIANETLLDIGALPLIFLAADDRLLNAAQVEGLATDNPNAHP